MTKVLSVASECAPLVKTGGLADVVGALPAALAGQGVEMRVLLPGYRAVRAAAEGGDVLARMQAFYGGPARLVALSSAGLEVIVLDAPHLFDRDGGPYLDPAGRDWSDNALRFAALGRAAALIAGGATDWRPDLVHAHDWQAGLAPYFIAKEAGSVPSVMTVHNIAFSGPAEADAIKALGLDRADFHAEGFEFWGRVSLLKAGLVWADAITTVSPGYAEELMSPEFGMGFDGLLRARATAVTGILNGIDTALWDPANDPHAPRYRSQRGKDKARHALRRELDLPETDGPLAVVVSRLTGQKGLDLLLDALPGYLADGGQLALLGSGSGDMEEAWERAAAIHPGLSVRIGYDEALSHRMIAGGDAIVIPSRFEPCGLTQLYGLRYGTVPVVARTGGLADTVIDSNDAGLKAGAATGIMHAPDSLPALRRALSRLLALYRAPETWAGLVKRGMRHPVGWEISAGQYAALYARLAAPA